MVDADDDARRFPQLLHEPLGDTATRPVLARAWWRWDLGWRARAVGCVDPKAFQAGRRRLRTRIVDPDIPVKAWETADLMHKNAMKKHATALIGLRLAE